MKRHPVSQVEFPDEVLDMPSLGSFTKDVEMNSIPQEVNGWSRSGIRFTGSKRPMKPMANGSTATRVFNPC